MKLLVDVAEGGRDLAKAIEAAKAFGLSPSSNLFPVLKTTKHNGEVTAYAKGAVVTMHEAGAEKWAAAGLCEIVGDA